MLNDHINIFNAILGYCQSGVWAKQAGGGSRKPGDVYGIPYLPSTIICAVTGGEERVINFNQRYSDGRIFFYDGYGAGISFNADGSFHQWISTIFKTCAGSTTPSLQGIIAGGKYFD